MCVPHAATLPVEVKIQYHLKMRPGTHLTGMWPTSEGELCMEIVCNKVLDFVVTLDPGDRRQKGMIDRVEELIKTGELILIGKGNLQ